MTTGLIGREGELRELVDRLEDHRLVTLVGPGGIGKTTLARAVVDRVGASYSMGTRFVDLTQVDEPEAVEGALAAQLGFPSFTALLESPTEQPALLVVDNCEHVLDAAAEAVDALLDACESPTVLATSRSPLDLPGEGVVAVGPLPLAEASVPLFLARARAAGIDLGEEHTAAVEALCRELDGVPLALEIAAARTRVLTPAEIRDRLDDLDTLSRSRFRGAERHRTLRATIDWSYVQLDDEDQRRFERLGVLAGPFTAETAHAVATDDPEDDDRVTLDGLEALVHHSLLVAEPQATGMRYRLLHPVRTFALERLEAREATHETWCRFVDHMVATGRRLTTGNDDAWRSEDLAEQVARGDDLVAALRWSVAHCDGANPSLELLGHLWAVIHQGHMEDTAELGERALERWPDPSLPGWADAMATVATCRQLLGRHDEAIALAEAALRSVDDLTPLAACALPRVLGRARAARGDAAGAVDAFGDAEAAGIAEGLLAFAREARSLRAVGLAALGEDVEARELLAATIEEAAAAGDHTNVLWARITDGCLRLRHDPSDAVAVLETGLAEARDADWGTGVVAALQGLAIARLALDDPGADAAVVELLDVITHGGAVSERRGALWVAAVALHRRGDAAWADVAATAVSLPPISAFTALGPELLPLPEPVGRPLGTADAIVLARKRLETPSTGPDRPTPAPAPAADRATGTFRRAGDGWEVEWAGRTVTLRTSKGMHDLARLLSSPGRDVHCLELAGAATEQASTGEVIDERARRDYEQRIRDLQGEIDEAESHNDHARAERAQAEFDAVVEHLAAALGLGGRARKGGSTAERARSAVTHRIRSTIRRLADEHPELGRHLAASVSTGVYCRYDPEHPTAWTT